MAILSTQLSTTSATAVYTSVNSTCCTVIYLCNTSNAAITVDVYVGASAVGATQIYKTLSIAATDTYVINMERIMFENGDKLWVSSSTASVLTVTISYIEV
jgi:hypothetical protein